MKKISDIQIEHITIGDGHRPFIIAEMSGNHNQSLDRALEIVQAAADAGAHAIKLQTYTPDTMTIDIRGGLFSIDDPQSLWHGKTLYELYGLAHTPWEWHKPIFEKARSLGLMAFSTPFDDTSVDFLEEIGVGAYKIASFENVDWPLLRKVARTGKPVIMSTGAATLADIDEAVRVLRENGCRDLVLLKCTSTYPATPLNSNILTIPHMRDLFNCHIGLSDHTLGVGAAVASVALGARVIEKHFTLRRSDGGTDAAFSIEPHELKLLVEETERAWQSLGEIRYGILKAEEGSLRYKRSLYVVKDVKKGEVFTPENVRAIRPGDGLSPGYYDTVMGMVAARDITRGTAFNWSLVRDTNEH